MNDSSTLSFFQRLTELSMAGNALWRWLLFCAVLLVSLVVGKLSRYFLQRVSKRFDAEKKEGAAVVLNALARPFVSLCLAVAAFLVVRCHILIFPVFLESGLETATRVLIVTTVGLVIYSLVDVIDFFFGRVAGRTNSKVDDMLMPLIGKSIRVTIVVLVVIQVAQEVSSKPITSILAGLGVGGLAIALAGQDTIKNFFGSLVIVADKPFEIGDRIVVDGNDGPVESVGFRSTKLRTLDGHLVTVPNSEMVNKTIRNIGKRPFIKHVANITITYDTPPDKVDEALSIVKELLNDHEGMSPDLPPRVCFNAFNDCSLNILVIFWYHPPEYWDYLAFVETFNRRLLRRYNEAGIEFAFPTQTVYIANSEDHGDLPGIDPSSVTDVSKG